MNTELFKFLDENFIFHPDKTVTDIKTNQNISILDLIYNIENNRYDMYIPIDVNKNDLCHIINDRYYVELKDVLNERFYLINGGGIRNIFYIDRPISINVMLKFFENRYNHSDIIKELNNRFKENSSDNYLEKDVNEIAKLQSIPIETIQEKFQSTITLYFYIYKNAKEKLNDRLSIEKLKKIIDTASLEISKIRDKYRN